MMENTYLSGDEAGKERVEYELEAWNYNTSGWRRHSFFTEGVVHPTENSIRSAAQFTDIEHVKMYIQFHRAHISRDTVFRLIKVTRTVLDWSLE